MFLGFYIGNKLQADHLKRHLQPGCAYGCFDWDAISLCSGQYLLFGGGEYEEDGMGPADTYIAIGIRIM